MTPEIPVANIAPDARGRLTLGKWLRGRSRYLVYVSESGTITLEPVK